MGDGRNELALLGTERKREGGNEERREGGKVPLHCFWML